MRMILALTFVVAALLCGACTTVSTKTSESDPQPITLPPLLEPTTRPPSTPPTTPPTLVPHATDPTLSDAEFIAIAQQLFTDHLTQFTAAEADFESRLDEFRIEQVSISPALTDGHPLAFVKFSVLPAKENYSHWMAGNGLPTESGWIIRKALFLDLVSDGDQYRIAQMGTSP